MCLRALSLFLSLSLSLRVLNERSFDESERYSVDTMTFSIPFLSLLFFSLETKYKTKTPERMSFFPRYCGQKHERRFRFQKGRFLVRAFLAKKSDASGRVCAHITRGGLLLKRVFFFVLSSRIFSLRCVSTPIQNFRRRRRRRRRERFFRRHLPTPFVVVEEVSSSSRFRLRKRCFGDDHYVPPRVVSLSGAIYPINSDVIKS